MQITISNTITIILGEQKIVLTKMDAENLYHQLGQTLGQTLGKNVSQSTTIFRDMPKFAGQGTDYTLQCNRMETKNEIS